MPREVRIQSSIPEKTVDATPSGKTGTIRELNADP
jgi:hypothetical protein